MQRSTESHVYLRCGLSNNNLQTSSMSSATGPFSAHTMQSNILAAIPIDVEFVHFASATDNEYCLHVVGPSVSAIRLYLTDSKNRPLGRIAGSSSLTAGPSSSFLSAGSQSTLGNLFFKCLIRVDVLQVTIPRSLRSKIQTPAIPARLDNSVMMSLPID